VAHLDRVRVDNLFTHHQWPTLVSLSEGDVTPTEPERAGCDVLAEESTEEATCDDRPVGKVSYPISLNRAEW